MYIPVLNIDAEALLSSIVTSSPDAIYSKSLDGTITSWSPGAERLYGYTASEAIGQSMLLVVPLEKQWEVQEFVNHIRNQESVDHHETVRVRKDGALIDVSITISPVLDAQGKLAAASVIGRDISERKRAERAILALNRDLAGRVEIGTAELSSVVSQLADSVKAMESFSYSVSRDLRAPLRHLDGFLTLLHKRCYSALDDSAKHYIDCALKASLRMGRLIDDLLHFSRMGRSEIHKATVDLNAIVSEVRKELEPDSEGRNVVWMVDNLPAVSADRGMLLQVLENLIGNALKFTRQKDVANISIGVESESESKVVIFVRDNGAGFDDHYYGKMFEVFQRLHGEDEFEGTGIGLAIARRVVERHGGRIWAKGVVGEGATFYFSLPRQPAEKGDATHELEADLVS